MIQRRYGIINLRSSTVRSGSLQIFLSLLYYSLWRLSDLLLFYCSVKYLSNDLTMILKWMTIFEAFIKIAEYIVQDLWHCLTNWYSFVHKLLGFFFFFFVVDLDWLAFDDLHSQFQDQRFNLASLHLARWRATHVSVSLNFLQTSKRAHRDIITPTAPFCHLLLISTHFCTFSFISFRAMCTRNRLTISGR